MLDIQVALDKITQFETADDIANFFRSEGVKAIMQDAKRCAISQWVSDNTGLKINTGPFDMVVNADIESTPPHFTMIIPLTGAMVGFIQKFDLGMYPDLVIKDIISIREEINEHI